MSDIYETTNDKKSNKTGKPENEWAGWEPSWTIPSSSSSKLPSPTPQTPHDFQEQHARTKAYKLRFSQSKEIHQTQRRIVDARLWDQMTLHQQEAALKIDYGYNIMSKGLGYRISSADKERISGSRKHDINDFQAEQMRFYIHWANICIKENLCHAACIDILIFGKSCRQVDKDRRIRKGWAKHNLFECLSIFCDLKGWPSD